MPHNLQNIPTVCTIMMAIPFFRLGLRCNPIREGHCK